MTELVAVFRSRTQAVRCLQLLRAKGVECTLIGTPGKVCEGCGLSVKIAGPCRTVRKIIAADCAGPCAILRLETRSGSVSVHPL